MEKIQNELKEADGPALKVEVKLSREEILTLHLLYEKEGRIRAELEGVKKDGDILRMVLSAKYGMDMSGCSVDLETGIAKLKSLG